MLNPQCTGGAAIDHDETGVCNHPAPKPRRGDGGNCLRCGKALVYAADDGLGPICRRIIAAEQAAGEA